MHSLRRFAAIVVSVAVFAIVLVSCGKQGDAPKPDAAKPGTQLVVDAGKATSEAGKPLVKLTKGEWTMFGGTVHRNFVNTVDTNIPTDFSVVKGKEKHVKWFADLGSKAYGGPIVADGKVFIGTNNQVPRNPKIKGDKGVIMCFNAADGKFLWQAAHDKLPGGLVNDWPEEGICSSPVVEGKKLWYVSNRCAVVCADTEGTPGTQEAKINWTYDMIKELHVFVHNLAVCSPLLVGDTLFVVTANGVDEGHKVIPEPDAPSFIALDKNTGKLKWAKKYPGKKIMHGQWSNASYADVAGKPHVIFPGGDGWIYGLDLATGDVVWKFDCNPKDSKYSLGAEGTRNDFIATPVIHDNKVYIGVGQDPEHVEGVGHLWCIDLVKALENAKSNPEHDVSPDLVTDDSRFPPTTKPNPASAAVWHYGGGTKNDEGNYTFGRTLSTCAIHDGLLHVAELRGIFHCLDAKTGKQLWEYDLDGQTWSSPYWVDGKVFMGNDKGIIKIFTPGQKPTDPIDVDTEASHVRAAPAAAGNVLYVMTESPTRLYAIEKK
jgi:outer membrane protein assembly factor BamB